MRRFLFLFHADINNGKNLIMRIPRRAHLHGVKQLNKLFQLGAVIIAGIKARNALGQAVSKLRQIHPAILAGSRIDYGNNLLFHLTDIRNAADAVRGLSRLFTPFCILRRLRSLRRGLPRQG